MTPAARTPAMNGISTMNEKALHTGLKAWYAQTGDRFEVVVDGYLIDIVRDGLLIEIQTANFGALKRKLGRLVEHHRVRLVYPVAGEKWILKEPGAEPEGTLDQAPAKPSRRRSPKRGRVEQVFIELVRLPGLLAHANFSLEVLLIREEEVRRPNPRLNWRRRGWGRHERRLLGVSERHLFESPADLSQLLPPGLPSPFTTLELAAEQKMPRRMAQAMAYCLRALGVIEAVGKRGNAILYQAAPK